MILIRPTGGMGNQMFQYALGTFLAKKNKTDLKVDLTLLNDRSQPHEIVTHRNFDLDAFRIPFQFASEKEIAHFNGKSYSHLAGKVMNKIFWELSAKKRLVVEQERNFQPQICALPDDRCLVGAWQSEKYFKPVESEIRKLYAMPGPLQGKALELGNKILSGNSLCVNARRGDFVTSSVYNKMLGAMPISYFQKAFEKMSGLEKIDSIFVFSDDPDWAKENLHFPVMTEYVGKEYFGPKYITYLHLMTLCRHFIIPNSTFAWWAAWLNTNPQKRVVAPLQWYLDPAMDSSDIIPETWLRV